MTADTEAPQRIALLDADPDLARHVTADEAPRARRQVTAPLLIVPEGVFHPAGALGAGKNPFAAIVLSGLVARELTVGGQPTLRLLGPGDIIHGNPVEAGLLIPEESYTATLPTRLAIIDDHFLLAVRHWPRLLTALVERSGEQLDSTLIQLAISQQPRVEDRLVAMFRALAERWGHVTTDGVIVPLSLTHEALGRLIGARRPTVTLALKALAAERRLERQDDGSWLLFDLAERSVGDLRPLIGAARPRLLALVGEDGTSPEGRRLIAEARALRLDHETLRRRLGELASRNEKTVARTQEIVERSKARRAAAKSA
ncbi:MAG: helix-turn-helix domain-containing protein [Solirubrobacteraceae bacterium]